MNFRDFFNLVLFLCSLSFVCFLVLIPWFHSLLCSSPNWYFSLYVFFHFFFRINTMFCFLQIIFFHKVVYLVWFMSWYIKNVADYIVKCLLSNWTNQLLNDCRVPFNQIISPKKILILQIPLMPECHNSQKWLITKVQNLKADRGLILRCFLFNCSSR